MFNKILVANRGEIALRIVRACRDLGIPSVAVYSEVDRVSYHVRYADEAYYIGPAEAGESYLNIERIIDVAKRSGADAIHPGYGFLAENPRFAEACADAGITFIGPTPDAMRKLGDKIEARQLMIEADVPVVPGSPEVTSADDAIHHANEIGYPVMIKAAAGGGGRGIRLVHNDDELRPAAERAIYEARVYFGNPAIYLEKRVSPARHIEIQIIADYFGNIVSLGERECSIQRRHQKIIEESPSVAVDDDLRRALGRAAKRAARAASYHSVGTIEFLLDPDGRYYFLEMNTRLQVEHPVTELTSGVDLVKDQIRVSGGLELPYESRDLLMRGWAIESRIVAEDPFNNFLPSVGKVVLAREPAGPGIRVESALYTGMEVTPFYDSLLAKVTAWGRDREEARARMQRALAETRIVGVSTNIPFLRRILDTPEFIAGEFDTEFLDRHVVKASEPRDEQRRAAALGALLLTLRGQKDTKRPGTNGQSAHTARNGASAWRSRMGSIGGWRSPW